MDDKNNDFSKSNTDPNRDPNRKFCRPVFRRPVGGPPTWPHTQNALYL